MSFNLFPKEIRFYDLFEQQNANIAGAAATLSEVFRTFQDIPGHCTRISALEKAGNVLCREIARHLSLTFITPIDREDIHELSLAQESVLTSIAAIAQRAGLYGFDRMRDAAVQLAENLEAIVKETSVMLASHRAHRDVDASVASAGNLKHNSDLLLLVALGELYEQEPSSHAQLLYIVKWSHIYERMEEALARADRLARVIEGISLKYS